MPAAILWIMWAEFDVAGRVDRDKSVAAIDTNHRLVIEKAWGAKQSRQAIEYRADSAF
jgi:hypothetical protein